MTYYLHRISHRADLAHPLLEQHGILSVGWSDFATRELVSSHRVKGWEDVPRAIEQSEYGKTPWSAPVSVNALIRSSLGISSGKLANLANSVSEKIDAVTDVSSDWFEGFRVVV